jgi:DNA-binding MarR family transcriptional regulator
MALPAYDRAVPSAALRDGRFSVWFSKISRALAQQMLIYARRELGLNLAEYRTLAMLAEYRSASIKDVAMGTELDKAQVTRAIANLTRRGLAIQMVDGRDRRMRAVKLTPAGRALMAKSLPFSIDRQKRMERALGAGAVRAVWKALAVLSRESQAMLDEEIRGPRARQQRARSNT